MTAQPPGPQFILASQSPRRQNLLREAGYEFTVIPADVNEAIASKTTLPADLALSLARAKAQAVADRHPDQVVLAADTVVAFGDRIIGKPVNATDARRIITLLSGTTHIVVTGVAVVHVAANVSQEQRVLSAVRMRVLSSSDIDRYIDTGLWEGKAGGYGIQDGNPFIKGVVGCMTNVVGLPMSTTRRLLAAAGIHPVPMHDSGP